MLTPRSLLPRPVEPDDVPAHRRLWTAPLVRRHLGGPVPPETVAAHERGGVGAPGYARGAPALAGGRSW
ncbi:hypothetical protein ACFU93_02375 [Streptomyces sp. NPDC057611]|uniref:hypothetical protein n=1 Tax=Streptomyces sp. NPDC057611 TaxID=3346182 RepID=UPI00368E96FB